MSPRTIFLARLLGLYFVLEGLAMVSHGQATVETMKALLQNPPILFLGGAIALGIGLAMVLGHNVWSGGALPVVVTLVGWISLIKGLLILFLPQEAVSGLFLQRLHYEQFFYYYCALALLLGLYLTYGGFRRVSR
jgi:uncharacterized membrane protein